MTRDELGESTGKSKRFVIGGKSVTRLIFSSLSLNMRVSLTHQNSSELRLYSTFDFVPIFQYIGFPQLTFTHSSKVVIKNKKTNIIMKAFKIYVSSANFNSPENMINFVFFLLQVEWRAGDIPILFSGSFLKNLSIKW